MGPVAPDAGSYLDLGEVARLRQTAAQDGKKGVREVARQFEGMMLQMMLKSMREAVPRSDLLKSSATDTYQELFDKQLAQNLAAKGGIGIADMIVRQMTRPTVSPPPPGTLDTTGTGAPPRVEPPALPLDRPAEARPMPAPRGAMDLPAKVTDGLSLRLRMQPVRPAAAGTDATDSGSAAQPATGEGTTSGDRHE
jgi:flagellar protein FlgJ